MALDPRIGILNSGKYYCFANGYDNPEVVGTLEEVEEALGLRMRPVKEKKEKPKIVRGYLVTVTPKWQTYSGTWKSGEYTLEIDAISAAEAISKARQKRRDEEGRYGVPADFRAKLA